MKVFVVTGLGFGDEGKGAATHYLCWRHNAHTVVRTGGPQAFHRVVTASGKEHTHSQFGSGTLVGAVTHLSRNMLIEPDAILNEGEALMYEHGIRGVFDYLTIDKDALVITPFQAIANRLRELIRGASRLGTVGIGVGETILDAEVLGDDAIYARDLGRPYLAEKLEAVRIRKLSDLDELIYGIEWFPPDVREKCREEAAKLFDEQVTAWTVGRFNKMESLVKIVDTDYFAEKVLRKSGTVIFESSQGVLLDRFYGFHPHTTKVRTIPDTALSLIDECGYDGEITSLGVLRVYHTRHGAGPFVTESSLLAEQLPDANNGDHPWQGSFRVGYFDAVAARYAIDVCGGQKALNGLVVSCIDRLPSLGSWSICEAYTGPDEADFFSRNNTGFIEGIKVRHGSDDEQLQRQEKLCQLLFQCRPELTLFETPHSSGTDRADLIAFCVEVLEDRLNIPVVLASMGPTERDRIELDI